MKNAALTLALAALLAMSAGCDQLKSCEMWECGFRGIEWEADLEDVLEDHDLELDCRDLHHEQYRRVGEAMVEGPAPATGEMVPLTSVLYGFCDDEFFEGVMLTDRSNRENMERIFGLFFGSTRSNINETVTYERGDVAGRIAPAEFEAGKIECVIVYLPLWRVCEGYKTGERWVQEQTVELEPCETCPPR